MSLPTVGSVLRLNHGDNEQRVITILAIDQAEAIWTVIDRQTKELLMITIDENGNWFFIEPTQQSLDVVE